MKSMDAPHPPARSRGLPRLLSASASAAILLAACGTAAPSRAVTTGSGGAVSFGVLSCFTGTLASLGRGMLQGSQVAQSVINPAGGIIGRHLSVSPADTGCNPVDAVPAVHQLLDADHAVGIIGPETQEIGAVSPIVTRAKIPTEFQGGSTAFDRNTDAYLWRDSPSDSQLGVAMALYAWKMGYKTAANLFYTDIAAQTFADPITASFQKLGGRVVSNVTVAPDQTSYRDQLRQIVDAHPQVVFTQTDAATAAVIFRELKDLNAQAIPIVGTDVTASGEYLKAIGYPVAQDRLVSVYGTSVTGPGADTFNKAFAAKFGAAQPLANANYAYDAVISLALAMDKAGTTDGPSVVKAMTKVTNPPGTQCHTYGDCLGLLKAGKKINYTGATGDIDYDSHNNVFGPYGAFRSGLDGQEQQVMLLSAEDLGKATP
jgi:ABC-type branched-subunit amino acid transport system substrate-binding protein